MEIKSLIHQEFERRVFNESYERIYKCLTMINDKDLWNSPNEQVPAIGNLMLHLCGNVRQWMLSGLGEKQDNRDRDQEFVKQDKIKKSELIFLLENLKVNVRQLLSDLSEDDLKRIYIIQGFHETGFSVVLHVIEHFSYHTGQIATLTKLHTGKSTGFFDGTDLNRHNLRF